MRLINYCGCEDFYALFVLIHKIPFYDVGWTDLDTKNKETSAHIAGDNFIYENDSANMHDHGDDVECNYFGYDFKKNWWRCSHYYWSFNCFCFSFCWFHSKHSVD